MTLSKTSFLFPSQQRPQIDLILAWILAAAALAAAAIAIVVCMFLVQESLPAFADVGLTRFFTDTSWFPTTGQFGLGPMMLGTLLATIGAVVLAGPLGLASGIFVHFYVPAKLRFAYRRAMEILAGIPSVVYGFWGLMVVVPIVNNIQAPGASLFAAIIILAMMILPTMAMNADAAIGSVPSSYTMAARALGLNRAGIVTTAILPAAKSRLYTGVILSIGRAIGETLAVMMVCGNIVQVPASIFDPVRTLTANIALEMAYATGSHRAALFVSGLLLLILIVLLVLAAEAVDRRSAHVN